MRDPARSDLGHRTVGGSPRTDPGGPRAADHGQASGRRAAVPWQVSFVLLAATWGCSFWWIKLGLEMLAPVQVAFVRLALGATALLVLCGLTRTRLPSRRETWRHLFVVALLLNSVPFTLFAVGETQVSSILAGIINATTPLATLVVVLVAFPEEHPTGERVVGLAVGFIGVLVVLGIWNGLGAGEWVGVAACVGAITCYGIAFPYVRRHLTGHSDGPIALATGQVLLGALALLPIALASGGLRGPVVADAVLGMLGLGVLGSGIAFVLNYQVISAAGATVASTVTYLTPVFAVAVGVAFLAESVTWHEPVGGLIVLLGVAIAQGRIRVVGSVIERVRVALARSAADGQPGRS
jgi:drug/metabolite transporter (DMT)-like permease